VADPDPRLVNELFFPTTFRVMGHIAKADGRVTEQEIASARAIMHTLHLQPAQIQAAIGYFTEGKQPGFDLDAALGACAHRSRAISGSGAIFRGDPAAGIACRRWPVGSAACAAAARGAAAGPVGRRLRAAGEPAALSPAGVNRWCRRPATARAAAGAGGRGMGAAAAQHERIAQAYSLLEATPQMSDEEVVKAYRRQMSRHHPDKLKANGLPPSMLERAKERTQQIQAAYELIRERRGMR
jgi:DnaJ like chaperone protein